ncbi:M18 family aminopeptidase [Aeromicrobium chenweiae]|uniref:M18 family aminopeptidase n=1 Tax=Aeromicrobium chenweiae TaxID=2079793 RepID=A0A2S0WL34_9ACTN|nr:M18 family aminopeptidase [Aeromicrobium chenweiae]AWB92045.1 M18 family aminopeptidase [Aeromicrobium chenweiae]TGN32894.1 M18 family aminopeptidase [Aeromicrobium chenweiae]
MTIAPAADLCDFIDRSPTPFHVCRTVAAELTGAGYEELREAEAWPQRPGRFFVVRGGSLVAWSTEGETSPADAFRVVGGHTDSPNLRVKQHHDLVQEGLGVVALHPYGGAWLNSWLDRDLGIAGRLALRDGGERLVHIEEPVLRVPQLAIHLSAERKIDLDPQRHLNGIWSTSPGTFLDLVADRAQVSRDDILGFELMTHDTAPSRLTVNGELVSAPRLDNQTTCFAGTRALLAAKPVTGVRPVLALFDHEEVGSTSERGAQSDLLITVLERIVLAAGGSRDDFHRAIAASVCASGDMAHATHPSHAERHEPLHHIEIGGGPVLKVHPNLRYATDAVGTAHFARACEQAGVPLQRYEHRADLPCGSTIGPLSAARTGMLTVDVGAPQLAMHSAREVMGAADVDPYAASLAAFLSPA